MSKSTKIGYHLIVTSIANILWYNNSFRLNLRLSLAKLGETFF